MTRGWRAATLAACIAGALVTPLGGRAVGRACAAGTIHVAIVVDTGTGSSVSAACVPAGAGDNGANLLATRASMLGTPQPRYGTSGLLCSIDGFPATGCGERQNGHYAYWSYWHGSGGSWTYANVGPAGSRVDSTVVEGWRWEPDGSASPNDPPPRVAPVESSICHSVTPATPPPTTPGPTRTTVKTAAPLPSKVASVGSAPTSPRPPDAGSPTAIPPRRTKTSVPPRKPVRASTPDSTPARAAPSSDSPSSTVALASGGIAAGTGPKSSGGTPIGLALGAVLVLGLFAVGVVAARRRRAPA